MMEVVVTTGAIGRAKLQSSIITTNKPTSSFFTGRMPFLSPNQQCQSTEGKNITSNELAYPKLGGLPTLSLTTNSSWLPWGRVAMPLISPLMPVPQQTIATRQHIWLLTSKLIKKTANRSTHRAVKYQICQHSIFCQLQKHGTFHLSKGRCVTCLVLVNVNFPYFMVFEYTIFMTCASWCAEFIGSSDVILLEKILILLVIQLWQIIFISVYFQFLKY